MEPQRFWAHLALGLAVFIAVGVSEIVSGGSAASGKTAGGSDVPPEGGFANPLPGASTGPTTGQPDDSKATKGNVDDRKTPEPGAFDHDSASPRKSPSSHADKHPDYDRMDTENKKALDKESH